MLVEKYNEMMKDHSNINLDRYINTKSLKRLQGRGQFCGMDYVGIKDLIPVEYYSRFYHSLNVAYTAAKLSDDLRIILAGLVHDVGTLDFSHVNSFKKGNAIKQDRDELDIKSILYKDEEFMEYLYEDRINLDDIVCTDKYPLIDKDIPCLCLDRAEGGILATCLFWAHTHSFEEIKDLYDMLCYIDNLNGMCVDC
ncbi:MAG: HD domain-containing protein, partial [Bacilli bacterium]|nr:HD domain-containing protein [Bacilli bacterium]